MRPGADMRSQGPTVDTAIALGLTTEEEHRWEVETFRRKDMLDLAMGIGLTRAEAERECDEWGFTDETPRPGPPAGL